MLVKGDCQLIKLQYQCTIKEIILIRNFETIRYPSVAQCSVEATDATASLFVNVLQELREASNTTEVVQHNTKHEPASEDYLDEQQ